jgi:phage tail-like protein
VSEALAHNFYLEIEGETVQMDKITGLAAEIEQVGDRVVDAETGDAIDAKIPGRPINADIVMTRAVTDNKAFWQWYQDILTGVDVRANCSIVVRDSSNTDIARWDVAKAWPRRVTVTDLDAGGAQNAVLLEEITLAHQGITRVDV